MKKFFLFSILALLAVTALQISVTSGRTAQKQAVEAESGGAQIGGDFTLTDQNGKTVHAADYHGRIALVFFGFSHCPEICPVTLGTVTKAMEQLGPLADQVVPIFISIDPENDSPAVLKDFLANFDKRMVGLTGTPEQIKQVAEAYKAYYSHPATPGAADYDIDHSAYIYMMGKDGKYMRLFPYDANAQDIAHALTNALH
jgi:protein SCO1/2